MVYIRLESIVDMESIWCLKFEFRVSYFQFLSTCSK
jgi:hypothetical protein